VGIAGGLSGLVASGGSLKGAALGALEADLFFEAGGFLKAYGGQFKGLAHVASKFIVHGLVGGLVSEIGQGNFASGFLAAGIGSLAPAPVGKLKLDESTTIRTIESAVLGGVGSVLGGGKFENGAITGAFGYLFNQLQHQQPQLGAKYENFFNQLYGPAVQISNDLGIACVQCVLGLAAYESGYYSDQHDIDLNNPWGSTQAGGNDIHFSSVWDAATFWANSNSWRFDNNNAATNSQFITDLQMAPAYNSVNSNSYSNLNGIINSVNSRMNIWLQEHPQPKGP